MATDDIERLHYYQRQYLGALDFEAQQAYHRDMRRRLNLAHHTWGIVTGLELVSNGTNINITPGMAIDGFGREIVMFTPKQLDPALFRSFHVADDHIVCLEYTEKLKQSPQAGYGQCDQPNQFSRVGENFQVVVLDPSRDDIMVNGQAIVFPTDLANPNDPNDPKNFFRKITDPAEDMPILSSSSLTPGTDNMLLPLDESVPYQELPADDPAVPPPASWLIPLGKVSWDGKQQFTGKSDVGRHYIGSVASRLLTPARNLVVRDRNTNVPLPVADPNNPDGVVMTIEGTLQVDRLLSAQDDIQIHDHVLDFRSIGDDSQTDDKKLFTISRKAPGGAGGTDLRLKIGVDNQGKNRFVVGTTDNNDLFMVDDKGNAHLAGSMDGLSITGVLDFGSQPRQMIALWSSQDKSLQNGIGIQGSGSPPPSATTYFRSSNDFYWFKGGTHSDLPGEPGGGQVQMSLDGNGSLHFDKDSDAATRWRQMLNLSSTRYGIGVQDSTLYYRSDFDFCWFKGGSHSNTRNDPGAGGQLQLKLDLNGDLYFGARTRQMLNLWNANYGIGVQNNTLYYRSDSDFCWFKGGIHNDTQDSPGGGTLQMKLDTSDGLDVYGPHIKFNSTTNLTFSVTLGQPRALVHGSDSIYGSPNLWLDTDGAVIAKQGFRMSPMNGAAFFPTGTPAPNNGDVVVLANNGTVIPSQVPNDSAVIGVAMVATDPGFILANQPYSSTPEGTLVALIGIVQCTVDNTGGLSQINAGSLLTTGNNQGQAQNAGVGTPQGAVFGKTLEVVPALQQKTIKVLLMPS